MNIQSESLKQYLGLFQGAQQPGLVLPVLTALQTMVDERPRREVFLFSGVGSGLRLCPCALPADGFGFCAWIRLERRAAEKGMMCVFSLAGEDGRGLQLSVNDGFFQYSAAVPILQ